ncbi:cation efflux system protein CzcA [Neisseria shayeganii 871]|uniref:Cation efflux system protein CzcA n=1 Tax=Neisseria shayeganii 871 TaxID=1032488 RepID=G4CH30_9NEIS|nr:cation efflux system protein CzcA [Neisseria shayeganii 871]
MDSCSLSERSGRPDGFDGRAAVTAAKKNTPDSKNGCVTCFSGQKPALPEEARHFTENRLPQQGAFR